MTESVLKNKYKMHLLLSLGQLGLLQILLTIILLCHTAIDCCDAWFMPCSTLATKKTMNPHYTGDTIIYKSSRGAHNVQLRAKEEDKKGEEDWRDVRAKLVFQYRNTAFSTNNRNGDSQTTSENDTNRSYTNTTNSSSTFNHTSSSSPSSLTFEASSWAYESGTTIETGSLIISRPIQDFAYGGLNQQYFHKSIILVVQHDNTTFTKGLILNRPTDVVWFSSSLGNEQERQAAQNENQHSCKVWYGGDVQGIHSDNNIGKELQCLHSLSSPLAAELSFPVVKNIQCIPWESAQLLISMGHASPQDFWLFCGYAGWSPGQLQNELDRGNWHMVAADSQTIWKVLHDNHDEEKGEEFTAIARRPDFGVRAWETLMERIGNLDPTPTDECHFEDEMLREWAKNNLISSVDSTNNTGLGSAILSGRRVPSFLSRSTTRAYTTTSVRPGTVLRASSALPSPFLLKNQVLHQSLILVLDDDKFKSVGVVLNRPSASSVSLILKKGHTSCLENENNLSTASTAASSLVLRFGGRFGVQGQSKRPIIWLHYNNQALREAHVGSPIAKRGGIDLSSTAEDEHDEVWSCTQEDAETAIDMGLAYPRDFLVVEGVTVWDKRPDASSSKQQSVGLGGEIEAGKYQVVSPCRLVVIWELLIKQEQLSTRSIDRNLKLAKSAWKIASGSVTLEISSSDSKNEVNELADKALRRWIEQLQLKKR